MKGFAILTGFLAFAACDASRPPPATQDRASTAVPLPSSRPEVSSGAALAQREAQEEPGLRLYVVARKETPSLSLLESGGSLQVLSSDCIATVEGDRIRAGSYPLPGPPCSERLGDLWAFGANPWLSAGPELWRRDDAGAWQKEAVFKNVHRVYLPTRVDRFGLALVIPYKQPTRSVYMPSASFELHALPGRFSGALPRPARAQRSGPSFDDFMSACSTTTRLGEPIGIHVTAAGQVLVFGTECDRSTNETFSAIERWTYGRAHSSFERLPLAPHEGLADAQIRADDDIWLAGSASLLKFDGKAWQKEPGPPGGAIDQLAVSPRGVRWVMAGKRLWRKEPGADWRVEVVVTFLGNKAVRPSSDEIPGVLGVLRDIFVDGTDALWLVTDSLLLSTRDVRESALCEMSCDTYSQEDQRRDQVPVGD